MLLEMNISLKRGNFDLSTDLSVEDQNIGLFGCSGAGKSTILGLLAGTLIPQSGRIALDGKILFDSSKGIRVPREKRPIGAVLQHDGLIAGETVKESLSSSYERTLKLRRSLKLKYLVELLDIGHLLKQNLSLLSTGERNRVLLAKALLKTPSILLLDDFLATMGHYSHSVIPFLKRVQSELKLPVVYASHTLEDIAEFSERILVITNGRVICIGQIDDLLWDAGLRDKLGLHQFENRIQANICSHDYTMGCTLAKTYGIELVLPLRREFSPGMRVEIIISSNDIALSRNYLPGISIQNQINGQICALIASKNGVLVQVDCGTVLLAGITLKACRDMNLQEGDSVYCLVKTHSFSYRHNSAVESFRELSTVKNH